MGSGEIVGTFGDHAKLPKWPRLLQVHVQRCLNRIKNCANHGERRAKLEVKVNKMNTRWQAKITREGWTQEKCFDQDKLTKRQGKKRK